MHKRKTHLEGKPLFYNASLQAKYHSEIQKLVLIMSEETHEAIEALFRGETADEFFNQQEKASASDASITSESKKLMRKLTEKFDLLFNREAPALAALMVDKTKKASESALKISLIQLSGGLSLNTGIVPKGMDDVANAIIAENVALIKSIPAQYLNDIQGAVMRSITTGSGVNELVPFLQKHKMISLRKARMIAYDQTRKAYTAINKQRLQAIGVKQYKWQHSGGGREPRPSHIAMDGNIYSFDNPPQINKDNPGQPPEFGIPGQSINCRCTMNPVINFEDEES